MLLPYWLRHYGSFCERLVVYDNESTDRTREIAKTAGVTVIPMVTNGRYDYEKIHWFKNEAWKESLANEVDWVIVVDVDEILWHRDVNNILFRYRSEGVTFPKVSGWNMIAWELPKGVGQIYEEINQGVPNKEYYSKRCVFNPKKVIPNYHAGCHSCEPTGEVIETSVAGLKLLHYSFFGWDWVVEKYRYRWSRFTKEVAEDAWRNYPLGPTYAGVRKFWDPELAKGISKVT